MRRLALSDFYIKEPRRSLRQQLIVSLSIFSLLLFILLGFSAYRISLKETQEILDQQMREMAYFLAETSLEHLDSSFRPNHHYDETDVFIDVWTFKPTKNLLENEDSDHIRLSRLSTAQFRQVHSSRGELKVFVLPLADRQIQISQQFAVRRHLAQELALSMMIPYIILVPLLLLGLNLLIRRLFKPVNILQKTIASRNHGDLSHIDTRPLPLEIRPAMNELNELFERIQHAQQQQQQFIADAAHELRSPITALNLQLQVLQKTLPIEITSERQFMNLKQGLQRMQHLVLQMMTLAHQDAQQTTDQMELPDQITDISATLKFVIEQLMLNARKKQLDLGLNEDLKPMYVAASEIQLQSIVFNILDNAIKYTPEGGEIDIQLRLNSVTQQLILCVEDSGNGVEPSQYAKLTERFVRLVDAQQNSIGSGLGLAIVQTAVQQLGGKLSFDRSSRLQGLKVIVCLPVVSFS